MPIEKFPEFPKTLYVQEGLNINDEYDAYKDLDGVEEDNIVAIYKLERVTKVKITKKTELVLANGVPWLDISKDAVQTEKDIERTS